MKRTLHVSPAAFHRMSIASANAQAKGLDGAIAAGAVVGIFQDKFTRFDTINVVVDLEDIPGNDKGVWRLDAPR